MAVSREVASVTKRKDAIIGLELKKTLKQMPTHTKMLSQAAILSIRASYERDDGGAFQNVSTWLAVLRNYLTGACRSLLNTTE